MRRSRLLLCCFALATVVLAACSVGDRPAATIGDREITSEELAADTALYRFLTGLSGAPCGTPVGDETEASACTRFTLANDIREEVVKDYATANDLAVTNADVATAIEQVETSLGGPEALDAQLEENGLVRADLQALARRLLLFGEVERSIVADRITDEELLPIYEQQVQQFTTVGARHILVETEAEAEEISRDVTGRNFADIAADRSIDTQSGQSGGDLGTYSEAQFLQTFDPTFAEAALALEVGEISGPVETQFGWHIIELTRRDVAAFEDVREQLAGQLGTSTFQEWMIERIQALDVEVNPRYGRLNTDTGEVMPIRSTSEDATGATGATAPAVSGGTGVGGVTAPTGPTP
jgi:foldase protein PrsA